MKKAAIILIIVASVIVIGVNWFLSSLTAPLPPAERDNTTLRSTEAGEVVGFIDTFGARAWMGVPFAKPPIGNLRWQAPEPPLKAASVIEALAPGSMCPQFASVLSTIVENPLSADIDGSRLVGDEDCLYLNVWSPPNARKLPVMFWIHGGGNSIGHGGTYIGAGLATAHNVVVVTINYRLGILGWFNHPALHHGDPADDSGNYGTLDVVRALEWTRDNISQFGGDPDNVTVFGESAGAVDTLAMMASPLAKGLFHRAVSQSGGFAVTSLAQAQNYVDEGGHHTSARELTNQLLVLDGIADDTAGARTFQEDWSNAEIRDYLYGKSAEDIFRVLDGGGFGMTDTPEIFGDGYVLPDLTTDEIFSSLSNYNAVAVILGTNRDEPSTFMALNPAYMETTFGIFASLKDADSYRRQVHYGARSWKVRGVDRLAEAMVASGHRDVYAYRWDWDEESSVLGYELDLALGAGHGLEIAFVFGEFERGLGLGIIYPDDEDQWALSKSMTSYWAEFAHSGDPGRGRSGTEVPWLAWGEDGKSSIILDSPGDGGIRMDDEVVSYASLKAEIVADSSFADAAERCATYVRNIRRTDAWDRDEYDEAGCRAYAPE